MPILILWIAIVFSMNFAVAGPMSPVFDRIWQKSKSEIYPGSLESRFTEEKRLDLAKRAAQATTLEELAAIYNPFLTSLGVSHTKFYQPADIDYYFMRSLFSDARNPDSHPVWHIGAQYDESNRVREVLEGYPAGRAGLRRGDLLVRCDGDAFHPTYCFKDGREVLLAIRRNGAEMNIFVRPVYECPARSFIEAMKNSARVISFRGKKLAYLHFWIGPYEDNIRAYDDFVSRVFQDTDALILDLRGGFGGASMDRVDHFFSDRSSYAMMSGIQRDGTVTPAEPWEPRANPRPYVKPMVVLINEGVRSGKEMMAFQFKKTKRAVLLGSTTAGMFVGGRMWFSDQHLDYTLYLAGVGALLDGVNLEGVGVSPVVEVPYPMDKTLFDDPQLSAALALAAGAKPVAPSAGFDYIKK